MNLNRFSNLCGKRVTFQTPQWRKNIPPELEQELRRRWNTTLQQDSDGFVLRVTEEAIEIYSFCRRGFLYGCEAVRELAEQGELRTGVLMAQSQASFRGIKLFLPSPDNLSYFYRLIDKCAELRYNTVILEVGGAMEYRRHPEINEGWIEYAARMNSSSGRANELIAGYPWEKNVVHAQNGGGKVLSQDTLRELISYCRERELEVIPEVPSLSHCDYLLVRHPELAERQEDPLPDCYCPSNPATYELLFDVLDEVEEVFQPSVIHIGHDELFSLGVCPLCREKDGAQLYADDIIRIRNYLAKKGIGVMIWAEKLLNAREKNRYPLGGALRTPGEDGWTKAAVPATYAAIDLIPRDIKLMHWYWSIDRRYEQEFLDRGFETVYGNLSAAELPEADKRLKDGIRGGAQSNWGLLEPDYIRRNGVLYDLYYNAFWFWMGESDFETLSETIWKECFFQNNQAVLKNSHFRVCHRAKTTREFVYYVDGIMVNEEADTLGYYEVTAADGRTAQLPVVYGKHLSGADCSFKRQNNETYDCYKTDLRLREVMGTAIPRQSAGEVWFETVYANPFPETKISGWRWVAREDAFTPVETLSWEVVEKRKEVIEKNEW